MDVDKNGIRLARVQKGLSQIEVAKRAGIAVNSLRLYEANKRQPTIQTLKKIANAIEVDVFSIADFDSATLLIEENANELHLFPPDLTALNTIMKALGYELGQENGEYTMTGKSGTYVLKEDEVENLLNSSVQYVEFLCEKLEKEISRFPDRRITRPAPPWTPPAAPRSSGRDTDTPAPETPAERKETPPQDNAQDGEEK